MSTYRNTNLNIQEGCSTFLDMAKSQTAYVEHDQVLVGRRLKALHLAKGWDSKTFAGMLKGVTPAKLGNWESGRHMVPVWAAIRAGMLTGADILFIYQGKMDNVKPDLTIRVLEELDKIENAPPRKVKRSR